MTATSAAQKIAIWTKPWAIARAQNRSARSSA
jgi:hypothetical protein